MRHPLALMIAALTAALCLPAVAGAQSSGERYIVVLKENVATPADVAAQHARAHGASVGPVWRHALKGYAATIPADKVARIRADSRVAYVERDGVVAATGPKGGDSTASGEALPWGVDRIDGKLDGAFNTSLGGSATSAYVIDSGIAAHRDLNIVKHVNYAGGKNTDCNGHGTHVAGTVAARSNGVDVIGVAPAVPLIGVKVLGCSGSGSTSGVINGVNWVTQDAATRPGVDVANMSLGGSASQALDDAVRNSAGSGVFYALAAGNSGVDACTESPARAGFDTNGVANGIVTVAATDNADQEASWSNYGSCVELWAPGVNILSTKRGGGTTTMSGTSMASPHVAGVAARYHASGGGAGTAEGQLEANHEPLTTTSKNGALIKLVKSVW